MRTTEIIDNEKYFIEWETTGEKFELGWEVLEGYDSLGNEFLAIGIAIQNELYEITDVEKQ
jgi:hypothetical protein